LLAGKAYDRTLVPAGRAAVAGLGRGAAAARAARSPATRAGKDAHAARAAHAGEARAGAGRPAKVRHPGKAASRPSRDARARAGAAPGHAARRADEVYLRLGPGKRYPIEWVYKRRDLPMRIEREFEEWRLVRDQENTKGWVHQATLAPRRTGVVTGGERVLRREAHDDAAPVARLKPGVIVRLRACEASSDWCQAQVQEYRGWIKRSEVWGILPGEGIQ